MKQVIT